MISDCLCRDEKIELAHVRGESETYLEHQQRTGYVLLHFVRYGRYLEGSWILGHLLSSYSQHYSRRSGDDLGCNMGVAYEKVSSLLSPYLYCEGSIRM